MSKLTKSMFALLGLLMFTAMPAFSQTGCKNGKFAGSYVTSLSFPDVWGDGSGVAHTNVIQLNLNSDGTAYEQQTTFPDKCCRAEQARRVLAAGNAAPTGS
jgi:hypothetical protein